MVLWGRIGFSEVESAQQEEGGAFELHCRYNKVSMRIKINRQVSYKYYEDLISEAQRSDRAFCGCWRRLIYISQAYSPRPQHAGRLLERTQSPC